MRSRRPRAVREVLNGEDVVAAARESEALLLGAADRSWEVPIPAMTWTVAETVAHIAEGCLWYAIDLSAGGLDLQAVEHRVDPESEPAELIATLSTYARLLSWVIDASPDGARGYHPAGAADPSGFAAMGCDEILIHTDDAARGLGVSFDPDASRCERVLARLFPWVPTDGDPWELLRWANGRIALEGRPRLDRWIWHCAPLEEWDGATPTVRG